MRQLLSLTKSHLLPPRFPFFTELQWFALDKYVHALLGRSHLVLEEQTMVELLGEKWEREEHERNCELYHSHLTPQVIPTLRG